MMLIKSLFFTFIFILTGFFQESFAAPGQTSFERVVNSGTIRCGYSVWYPQLIKDPNTGALSGFDYEVMNLIGSVLGLNIEWVEEVGWGVTEQGLVTKRYDISCNSFWGPPTRTKTALYSEPIVFHPLYAVIRQDMNGSLNDYEWLNSEKYKAAIIPGTIYDNVGLTAFPKAQKMNSFELSTDGNLMMDVASSKADFSYSNYTSVKKFLEDNPGSLKVIDKPVFVVEGRFLMPNDDFRLKHMIDDTIGFLVQSGEVDKIMRKYMKDDKKEWISVRKDHSR